jgi:hypothetical protein
MPGVKSEPGWQDGGQGDLDCSAAFSAQEKARKVLDQDLRAKAQLTPVLMHRAVELTFEPA